MTKTVVLLRGVGRVAVMIVLILGANLKSK